MEKKQRKRDSPTKKWTEEERQKIVDFIADHRDFEKPTAQIYYKKLIREQRIDASWTLLKCKVRYMRETFKKTKAWLNSTDAEIVNEDDLPALQAKVNKMCPHYESFDEIFSKEHCTEEVVVQSYIKTEDSISEEDFMEGAAPLDESAQDTSTSAASSYFAERTRKREPNGSINELVALERKRDKFRQKKLELEKEKFGFEQVRFQLEYELQKKRLEIEEQKMRNEFELKKMELAQRETLAKYEIDVKNLNNK